MQKDCYLFLIEKCSALGGVSHHSPHSINIVPLKHGLQIVKFADKQIHLFKQNVLVGCKKLAPHQVIDTRDSCKIAEGVARELLHIFLIVAGHQRDGNTVCKLREEADHFVMLLGRKCGHVGKSEKSAKLNNCLNGFGKIISPPSVC